MKERLSPPALSGLLAIVVMGASAGGCRDEVRPYDPPLYVTSGLLDASGQGVAFVYDYEEYGSQTTWVAAFGESGCKRKVERIAGVTFAPLWSDDRGIVVRFSAGSSTSFGRIGADGALENVAPAGTLPAPAGASAPRFLFDGSSETTYELDSRGFYAARPVAPSLAPARGFGVDDAGRTYGFAGADRGGSLKTMESIAAPEPPDVPITGELRAVGIDGRVLFSAGVAAGTRFRPVTAHVRSGGVVVLDRNRHLRRFAPDGGVVYDVELSPSDGGVLTTSPNGSVAIRGGAAGNEGTETATLARYAADGRRLWSKTFAAREAGAIVPMDDGRTWLLGTERKADNKRVVRIALDAAGNVTARDTCALDGT